MKRWIVQLEPNVWLANWGGDPGRTVVKENAKRFSSFKRAVLALQRARSWFDFPNASIDEVER